MPRLETNQAAKHTPGPLPCPAPIPWKRGHDLGHAFQVVKSRHQNEWVIVAEAITAKDADLICRAVNAHAGLVEAARAALDQIGICCADTNNKNWHAKGCAVPMLRAAIAKAQGE
jgi:hypothetical protein